MNSTLGKSIELKTHTHTHTHIYIYIYIYIYILFHHKTCKSTCDTLPSSAANQDC